MEIQFRPDREALLKELCAEMGRSVDDFCNEAILTFMEDFEDARAADAAIREMEESGEQPVSLEEVMRGYGMDCGVSAEGAEATEQARPGGPAKNTHFSEHQAPHAA